MSVAVPADYTNNMTAGYHTVPQGAAAFLTISVTIRNDASYPVQVDYYITQDQDNANCIAAGSLVFQGGGVPEHKEFSALSWNLPAGTRRWDLWLYARGAQCQHLESWIMPKIYKA